MNRSCRSNRAVRTIAVAMFGAWLCLPAASVTGAQAGVSVTTDPETGAQAGVSVTTDPETGLKRWQWEGNGLGMELIQVPPDFIRASYAARDLPETVIEAVATRCVFGTIVRNIADRPLAYRVADWRYTATDGVEQPIKTKSEWLDEWHGMGVRFSWSILADDAEFAVGDWIQGFTTMPEPHGSRLNLKVVWTIEGARYEKVFSNLECATAPSD